MCFQLILNHEAIVQYGCDENVKIKTLNRLHMCMSNAREKDKEIVCVRGIACMGGCEIERGIKRLCVWYHVCERERENLYVFVREIVCGINRESKKSVRVVI